MDKGAPPFDGATKRFAKPKSEEELEIIQKNSEPLTTARTNKWAVAVWNKWSKCRLDDHKEAPIGPPYLLPSKDDLYHWMTCFIVEIRCKDGKEYSPNTLYAIACAVMKHIRNYCPELNFFTQPEFHGFKTTLDSEMKRFKADGVGLEKRRADPISVNDEEQL
uniref:QRICH1-like domain-containing protein n=1 Tax=Amphimedon queenslandica TaxID=400682 RepID=A0A1X7V1I9_AMPQE